MAAFRGPSSTRKSSRFSSPVTVARIERETPSNFIEIERAREMPQTFLEKWVEPPLRTPAPSFEDHRGLERMGVLEHFQPLGQPPTQKFLQKLKLAPPRAGRATPVQSEEVSTPTNGVEEMSTASPAEELQRAESADESRMSTNSGPPVRVQQESDSDYHSAVPPAPAVAKPKMASQNGASIPPTPLPTGGYIYHGHYHPETIKQHVEAAVRRAEIQSPELVPGLRKLCADSELDPALWAVLDAVLNQSPTRDQFKIFHRYVRAGKKEHSCSSTPPARATSLARVAGNQHVTPTQHNPPLTTHLVPVQLPPPAPPFSPPPLQPPVILHPQPTLPVRSPNFQQALQFSPPQPSVIDQQQPSQIISAPSEARAPPSILSEQSVEMASADPDGENAPAKTLHEGLQNLEESGKNRSQSVSSSSSLSSAKSLDAETFAPAINEEAQTNGSRAAAKSGADQRQATAHKPGGNKSRGPKIGLFSIFPNTHKTNARKQTGSEIDELELSRRRQRLQQNQSFHEDYNSRFHTGESSIRALPFPVASPPLRSHSTSISAPVVHPHNAISFQATLSSPVDTLPSGDLSLRNGISKKRSRDDTQIDQDEIQTPRSSPGPLLVPPPPGTASISRSGTPRGSRMPPVKRVKKSARVMVSPNKPKTGAITAGIARAGPGRDSSVGNGVDSSEEENNDYCAACGGNGQLLCCDGCPNSFHFSCLDPPMKGPPEGSWYCSRCVARLNHGPAEVNGIFGRLIGRSDDINPKAFGLPFEIREYFDGIRTGEEGEYEDVGLPRTQTTDVKMNRAGFIEEPDYKKLRDSKGNVIFCYRCRLTSNGKREIIPCDFCPYRWHLDCLDPPLAVPPRRRNGDKPNATWRCPLHVENDVRSLDNDEGSILLRQPRHRMPKNPIPRDVCMTRGFRNNGVIDVDLMKDDEQIDEVDMLGTIYRLPEKGIRLDFLDRIRRSRYEDAITRQQFTAQAGTLDSCHLLNGLPRRASASVMMEVGSDPINSNLPVPSAILSNLAAMNTTLRAKTFREQQAVLSLQALALQDNVSEKMLGNQIAELTDKLILGAGEDVAGLAEKEEREQLEAFRKLIERRLEILGGGGYENANGRSESSAGNTIVVNGAQSEYGDGNNNESGVRTRSESRKGISKSQSRERRGLSRGRT